MLWAQHRQIGIAIFGLSRYGEGLTPGDESAACQPEPSELRTTLGPGKGLHQDSGGISTKTPLVNSKKTIDCSGMVEEVFKGFGVEDSPAPCQEVSRTLYSPYFNVLS